MSTRRRPVIVNHLDAGFGRLVAAHPSQPVVVDDLSPAEPWRIDPEADILVTRMLPGWSRTPAGHAFPDALKWVQVLSTGVETYPPRLMQGRLVTCGRGLNAVPIAEFVFAAMLRIERGLEQTRARAEADWRGPHAVGRLHGRTLGLIGYGSIGKAIARRALAFDMRVLAHRRTPWQGDDGIIACADPADVFAGADHLVIAAPLTPRTQGLVGAALLKAAKPGLHLVNISRAGLIDQEALVEALESGRIGHATLDVTTPEPLPDGHPLYRLPNVFVSPHISWCGGSSDADFHARFLANLDAHLAGAPLEGAVDPSRGY
ncbi:NAD(P)-dependent oxidoreductase [Kumtagia ephedrae]|uniref:NAD(P)-dependent oxidoreductase n=1 Tax=Kumtagia ephedrae TaxID=2116701 RepID=UPI0010573C83|nr:NAD(P)-dependent oxidoreductase [Mesorhizobium ephedrae]